MNVIFEANKITYETNIEDNYYMIGFSDNGDAPDKYVIIERAMAFDEQDIELGMGTYYFEYSDQSNSGYGICENVKIETNKVLFDLKENTFDNIEKIEVTFEKEKLIEDWNEFKNVFNKIFA
jgi:hypothetical protein